VHILFLVTVLDYHHFSSLSYQTCRLKTPNFYIVLPSTTPAPSKLRGKVLTHQSPRRDYYSRYSHNGLLADGDVCIGKLTAGSISTLNKLLELPTHFSKAGGDPVTDKDPNSEEEEGEGFDVEVGAPLAIFDVKYQFEKPATITRARIKS
jgi:hypothetical protein